MQVQQGVRAAPLGTPRMGGRGAALGVSTSPRVRALSARQALQACAYGREVSVQGRGGLFWLVGLTAGLLGVHARLLGGA